jgi:glyoxylase-like metal-dependent hydrolase (beta-lactamase superfamily II)
LLRAGVAWFFPSICRQSVSFVFNGTSLPAINHRFKHPQSDPAGFFAAAVPDSAGRRRRDAIVKRIGAVPTPAESFSGRLPLAPVRELPYAAIQNRGDCTMKVHAIQTGLVRIKTAQVEGRGHGLLRRLAIFTDPNWAEWLPTYAWVIDSSEGIIVVDTGQGTHLLETGKSLHPYIRWEVAFRIEREQEIGPQLRALGIGPRDVKRVVLTHLHMDHDGGLVYFPDSEILVAPGELETARGIMGRIRGYLPNRWPSWFDPKPLDLAAEPFGPFVASRRLTQAGDVVAVATPGHTADHISIIVEDGDTTFFLAGDTSYNEELMLAGKLDGVSADEQVSGATLGAIRQFTESRPTVYLPTHDPYSPDRLAKRRVTGST